MPVKILTDAAHITQRLTAKHILEIKGYSLTDVATRAGVTPAAVTRWLQREIQSSPRIEAAFDHFLTRKKAA